MTRRLLVLVAGLPLVFAGCADDDPEPIMPKAAPTSASPTAEPSPSPTGPVEPTMPPETQGTGVEAAIAFVEHYYDTVTYGQATGDTDGLETLALTSCVPCRGGLKSIRRAYDKGGYIVGGDLKVVGADASVGPTNTKETAFFTVQSTVDHADENVYLPGSSKPKNYPRGSSQIALQVVMDKSDWHIADWEITR